MKDEKPKEDKYSLFYQFMMKKGKHVETQYTCDICKEMFVIAKLIESQKEQSNICPACEYKQFTNPKSKE